MTTIEIPGYHFDQVELVIFDKDGTLMDLHLYWSQMIRLRAEHIANRLDLTENEIYALMGAMGVDASTEKLYPEGPVGIKKREIVMGGAVDYLTSIGYKNTSDLCNDVFEEVDTLSSTILNSLIHPIPGALELISLLADIKCKIAIATTDWTSRAQLAMKHLGFEDKIDLVVGADMVPEAKPSPDMIYHILRALDINRSHVLMVGDAITDVEMGINAGVLASIGVLTGQTPYKNLRAITPYIIGSIVDMKVINK